MRAGFRALLDAEPQIEVVAEAATGRDAVALVASHAPDLLLMDIRMPGTNGIEATRQIGARAHPPQVLILTTFDTDENVFDALKAGAAGFLVKDTPPTQLIDAVRAAVAGGAVISASVAGVAGGFVAGVLAFAALGLLLGSLLPTARAAQGTGLLLFFGLFFIAGGGPPPTLLPDGINRFVELTPMGPLVTAISDPWHGRGNDIASLVALAVLAVVAGVLAERRLRRA